MPSTSAFSTLSPISKLPYDILLEIFIHCLQPQPQYLFDMHQHSHPRNAPILLCHICSSWRTLALTAPTLWTRLSYVFTIVKGDDYDVSGTFKFLAREIEFVRWWRVNQGHVAPSLNFYVCKRNVGSMEPMKADDATSEVMDFLLESIFAAQFLDMDEFFWRRIEQQIRAGHRMAFPNLHTLLMKEEFHNNESFHAVLRLLPDNGLPALRRIAIMESWSEIACRKSVHVVQHWSMAITHVFLHGPITPDFWYECLEAFPNMRWGSFAISFPPDLRHATVFREPGCTLLQLETLRVSVEVNREPNELISALTLGFGNLHLPALRTLSLSSHGWSCLTDSHFVLNDLDNVLRSTPALTTLILEDNFLTLCSDRNTGKAGHESTRG